jgi:hypothetical protein
MLIPVVINKQSRALVGLANGFYSKQDSEIIFEVLPRMWTNVILESVAKTEKDRKARGLLEETAKEVEETKKMVSALMNIMRDDDEDSNQQHLDRDKMLKKKLTVIADYLEERFGGGFNNIIFSHFYCTA